MTGLRLSGLAACFVYPASTANLETIRPTPDSFAILIDEHGHLIAAPERVLSILTGRADASGAGTLINALGFDLNQIPDNALAPVLSDLQSGQPGLATVNFGAAASIVSYAPLPDNGWHLAVAAPVAEITAQVYLLDEAKRYALPCSGTGEIGQQLVARGHRLDMAETSLVAAAVQTGELVQTAQILTKDKPVALEVVEEIPNLTVKADPIRLRQIVWNRNCSPCREIFRKSFFRTTPALSLRVRTDHS